MTVGWQPINRYELVYIEAALQLLKATAFGYDHLTKEMLNDKMQPGEFPDADGDHCLRLFSLGTLTDPQVSAFFFLRRRRKMAGWPDWKFQWAQCLTVGAKESGNVGLPADQLLVALNEVCNTMKGIAQHNKIEIMHTDPRPVLYVQNLIDVFDKMHQNNQPPKTKPRFNQNGTITLGHPWVPLNSNGQEQLQDFVWLSVLEDPSS